MSISENIFELTKELDDNVKLIAVSKTKPIEYLKEAYDAGIRDFGENKVQEILSKISCVPEDIRWHLIGHLQRNKVKYIVGKVCLIQSLDSTELLNEIEKRFGKENKTAYALIQINIGKEENKTGIAEEKLEDLIDAIETCNFVKVKGLMAVIPKGTIEECRYYFKNMRQIFDKLKKNKYKNINMEILSMGMTNDYQIAVEEGSNMIRIGEGIFGKRNYVK